MDISFLTNYMVPVIVGICLCVGYIAKHWIADLDNRVIPTLCAALGVALSCWVHWPGITPEVILAGLVSGLAATGLHQVFKQWLGDKQ